MFYKKLFCDPDVPPVAAFLENDLGIGSFLVNFNNFCKNLEHRQVFLEYIFFAEHLTLVEFEGTNPDFKGT